MEHDIRELARDISSRPRLLEAGREEGRRFYRWSVTDLLVAVDAREVHLARRRARVAMPRGRVPALIRATDRWAKARERWAAFYAWGLPPVGALARHYLPPYAEDPVQVGGRGAAGAFSGRDTLRELPPTPVADGVTRISEWWRVEERVGPPEGALIGERWTVGDALVLDALRRELVLGVDDEEVRLRSGDAAVFRAIYSQASPRRSRRKRSRSRR